MEEVKKMGRCPHGEFPLAEGCPLCRETERLKREDPAKLLMTPLSPNRPQGDVKENIAKMENSKPPFDSPALHETEPAAPTNIVKVQYLNDAGEATGRQYSYFTAEPLGLGEVVQAPVTRSGGDFPEEHLVKAVVAAVNVPEAEIAAFRDRVKTITKASLIIEAETPPVAQVAKLFDKPADEAIHELAELPEPIRVMEHEVGYPPEFIRAFQEAECLLEAAQGRTITKNEDLKPATDDLAIIRNGIRKIQEIRKQILAPYRTKVDTINAAFAEIIRPLEEADRLTVGKVTTFESEQRRKAAEANRIEDEKFKLAQEEAALKGGEITVPLDTIEAPPPVPERTRTELGTLSGRDNWKARVIDMAALPDEYKLPDMQTLNAKARSSKGTAIIPGVEFYNDRSVQVRTK